VSVETAQDLLKQEADWLEMLQKQVKDPAHLPPKDTDKAEESAAAGGAWQQADDAEREYEYTKDVTISINGKSYEVTIQKWK
jgi:hypothetical protein